MPRLLDTLGAILIALVLGSTVLALIGNELYDVIHGAGLWALLALSFPVWVGVGARRAQ